VRIAGRCPDEPFQLVPASCGVRTCESPPKRGLHATVIATPVKLTILPLFYGSRTWTTPRFKHLALLANTSSTLRTELVEKKTTSAALESSISLLKQRKGTWKILMSDSLEMRLTRHAGGRQGHDSLHWCNWGGGGPAECSA
jgi:hypothetical protein